MSSEHATWALVVAVVGTVSLLSVVGSVLAVLVGLPVVAVALGRGCRDHSSSVGGHGVGIAAGGGAHECYVYWTDEPCRSVIGGW